jgi:DNA-binding NtrC family response regulator
MSDDAISELLIGSSPALRHIRALIAKIAPTELPVLIQGPTGSGKELVARAIHVASGLPGAFVAFNVCAIAEPLFEAALFGHARGAFTGALTSARGLLAEADRGTAFFDEIGGLALGNQAKLLRAIELRQFRPVGARADLHSAFRTVAATNEDLTALVDAGRMRADLAHRLAGIVIDVPPLADRPEDIPVLARHFARVNARKRAVSVTLSDGAIAALVDHTWPGNVRELRHTIERAVVLAEKAILRREDVAAVLHASRMWADRESDDALARRKLRGVLEMVRWDTAQAAEYLGWHRATVYRHMKRLGIRVPVRPSTDDAPDNPRAVRADAS